MFRPLHWNQTHNQEIHPSSDYGERKFECMPSISIIVQDNSEIQIFILLALECNHKGTSYSVVMLLLLSKQTERLGVLSINLCECR